jgi:hypothetical protein
LAREHIKMEVSLKCVWSALWVNVLRVLNPLFHFTKEKEKFNHISDSTRENVKLFFEKMI